MNYLALRLFNLKYSRFDYNIVYADSPIAKGKEIVKNVDGVTRYYTLTEFLIPLNILKDNSSFTAIVHYLKDQGMTYKDIAVLLNRDQRTIWTIYNRKMNISINHEIQADNYSECIPINIFSDRTLSVLENIVIYLKSEYGLTFNEIVTRLGKNYQTIWTAYRRALRKFYHE